VTLLSGDGPMAVFQSNTTIPLYVCSVLIVHHVPGVFTLLARFKIVGVVFGLVDAILKCFVLPSYVNKLV
jgi:hypothetical protein